MSSLPKWSVLIAAILLSVAAKASDWKTITSMSDGVAFMDYESVAPREGVVKAWFMFSYDSEKTQRAYPFKKYQSGKQLNNFKCREKSSAVVQGVYYSKEYGTGEVVDSESIDPAKVRYDDVVPDTIGEAMLDAACSIVSPQSIIPKPLGKGGASKK